MTGKLIQLGQGVTIVLPGGKYIMNNHGTIVKEEDGFILLEADNIYNFSKTKGYVWINKASILEMFYDEETKTV